MAEQFKLEVIKETLILELFMSLKDIHEIPEVVENSEAFKYLSHELLSEIILHCGEGCGHAAPASRDRFDSFIFWYKDKKHLYLDGEATEIRIIVDSFDFEDFEIEELLELRNSGIFSKKIDSKISELFHTLKSSIAEMDGIIGEREIFWTYEREKNQEQANLIIQKDNLIETEKQKNKELTNLIIQKDTLIATERQRNAVQSILINQKDSSIANYSQAIQEKEVLIGRLHNMNSEKQSQIEQLVECGRRFGFIL